MKKLIITEKPSVARQFAAALGVSGSNDGYIENGEWVITWCIGHLITLSDLEKYDEKYRTWNIDDLPFIPDVYKYEVIDSVKKQFSIVKKLLNRKDVSVIYNAGDSGREGEYIQRLVYSAAGIQGKKKILRVWIDSQTGDEIRRGIRYAGDSRDYDNLAAAAYERAIEDFLIGINLSRAFTCRFGYAFTKKIGAKSGLITVGRVQTCVLAMVVEREREIDGFVPTVFYRIDALCGDIPSRWKAVPGSRYEASPLLYNDTGFKDRKDAEAFLAELGKDERLKVLSCEKKKEQKRAPFLFNLAELQGECSKRFKVSPDETLAVAQSLYEKGLTTYPRTDARVLSSPVAREIRNTIAGIGGAYAGFAKTIIENGWDRDLARTKYVNDDKITDHYAIVPTGKGDASSLTGLEEKVYDLITRRFLSIFYPAAEYEKTDVVFVHSDGEKFFVSEKHLVKAGYMEVSGKEAEEKGESPSGDLSSLKEGMVLPASFSVSEGTTKPPRRFTSGNMVLAMENAGRLIEDAELREQIKSTGIGTSATRADTIKKLVDRNYIALEKKTQVLTPTPAGYAVYDIVKECFPKLLSPEMTASWEKGLSQIETGKIEPSVYRQKMAAFVTSGVEAIKKSVVETPEVKRREEAGTCPVCGKVVYRMDYTAKDGKIHDYYLCSGFKKNDKKSCRFGFGTFTAGKELDRKDTDALLKGEKTEFADDFRSEGGSPFTARLVIKEGGQVGFEFPSESTSLACPSCGRAMQMGKFKYECPSCGFGVWHTISGRKISEDEMKALFADRLAGPLTGFKTSGGEGYSAYLVFTGKDVCAVREKISGYTVSETALHDLIENGRTDVIEGFVSRAGKPFKARLVLDGSFCRMEFENEGNRNEKGQKRTSSGGKKTYPKKRASR